MKYNSIVICGPGKARAKNQDNYYLNGIYNTDPTLPDVQQHTQCAEDAGFYAVADGMGGERSGEAAALLAVRELAKLRLPADADAIAEHLLGRNDAICRFFQADGTTGGTTFVGIQLSGKTAVCVNIGDSRAYLFRKGRMVQLSRDHTLVQRMLEMGTITPEIAKRHPARHQLSQNLGIPADEMLIQPRFSSGDVRSGDIFLLCSDGLTEMVEDREICRILANASGIENAALSLFEAAMNAGGKDNITVLLINAEEKV